MDTIIIPIFKSLREVKNVALVTELVRDMAGVLNQGQSVLESMLLMVKLHCWKELGRHIEVGTNLSQEDLAVPVLLLLPKDMSRPVFLSPFLQFSQPLSNRASNHT